MEMRKRGKSFEPGQEGRSVGFLSSCFFSLAFVHLPLSPFSSSHSFNQGKVPERRPETLKVGGGSYLPFSQVFKCEKKGKNESKGERVSSEFGNDGSSSKVSLLFQVTCEEESTSKEDFLLTILPGEEEEKNSY